MKKIIQVLLFILANTFSYESFSECVIKLPFDKLSDCIVMEGTGVTIEKAALSKAHLQTNAIDKFSKISGKEVK
ncbi:MAG TPA: hypothetical protein ENI65_06240 [Gammaproteobacteria bacterium]|nr:hypothetical protein [Gammaproteobacteria bacterium]